MKLFIMSDLEGVAGVVNRQDWVLQESRYYETARELLSMEVNAAAEGFFEGGADEIYVADGHGAGGINHLLLDSRLNYIRGFPGPWPFTLDTSFDAIAWVGQHAKACTEYAHLAHTQSHRVIDCRINGISVGEFGQLAICASFLGVIPIFLSGDEAAAQEAKNLLEGIETVAVKRGLMPGSGREYTFEEYKESKLAAIHLSPQRARTLIKEGAKKAMARFVNNKTSVRLMRLEPPFEMVTEFRPAGGSKGYVMTWRHPQDVIAMLNSKGETE